jgi:hypothetical protein
MRTSNGRRTAATAALALLLAHSVAIAEVSVQRNPDGSFKRFFYLTRGGSARVTWGQVRPYLAPGDMLNPLGDNLGDLAPVVRMHPVSGLPWVFWSRNVAGLRQVVFAAWTDLGWTAPQPIVPVDGLPLRDELDPAVAFDLGGAPFLVWWRGGAVGEVVFSTRVGGRWTPPMLLSDPAVDSRRPAVSIEGTRATVSWTTPAGIVTQTFDTAVLVTSATDLMDTPIPPGNTADPGGESDGTDEPDFLLRN